MSEFLTRNRKIWTHLMRNLSIFCAAFMLELSLFSSSSTHSWNRNTGPDRRTAAD